MKFFKCLNVFTGLVLIAVLFSSCTSWQYHMSNVDFQNGKYAEAIAGYNKVLKRKSKHLKANKEISEAYFKTYNYELCADASKRALALVPDDSYLNYKTGLSLKMIGECAEGKKYFERYCALTIKDKNPMFDKLDFCSDTLMETQALYKVSKFSNLPQGQYINPITMNDSLYFLYSASNNKGQYDIYSTSLLDVGNPQKVTGDINSDFPEGPFDLDSITKTLYVTRHHVFFDQLALDKSYIAQLQILKANQINGKWTISGAFEHNASTWSVGHPAISPDGKFMIFVSNKPGGIGETDLYLCQRKGDTWSDPELIASPINSTFKELTPSIARNVSGDGYLVSFSSDRPSILGGLDVYSISFDGTNQWGELIHHSFPINTHHNEFSARFNTVTMEYMISSDRDGPLQYDDIFSIGFDNKLKGKLYDKNAQKPIANATLLLENKDSKTVQTIKTDSEGSYQFNIPPGDSYEIKSYNNGYDSVSKVFYSRKDIEPLIFNLDLITTSEKPVELMSIVMNDIYFGYDDARLQEESSTDLEKLFNTLTYYPNLKIRIEGHTDCRGKASYNLKLSKKRALAVENWLLLRGVNAERVVSDGLGESQPINKCIDDVECLEEEHSLNRRTTFSILQQ